MASHESRLAALEDLVLQGQRPPAKTPSAGRVVIYVVGEPLPARGDFDGPLFYLPDNGRNAAAQAPSFG